MDERDRAAFKQWNGDAARSAAGSTSAAPASKVRTPPPANATASRSSSRDLARSAAMHRQPVAQRRRIVRADVIDALRRGEELGRQRRRAALGRVRAAGHAARNDLRDTDTITGRPKRRFSRPIPRQRRAATPRAAVLRKNPMPGIEDQPLAGDAGRLERGDPRGEEIVDSPPYRRRPKDRPAAPGRAPATACMTTSRHARRGQIGVERRVGKTLDVVEIVDAARQRETLRLGLQSCRPRSAMPSAASAAITGSSRRISSSGDTGCAAILLAAAPRSTTSAPPAASRRACAIAAAGSRKRPPSENKSSVMLRMPNEQRRGTASAGAAALEDRADPLGVGKHVELFDRRPGRARRADRQSTRAQIRSAKPSHRSIWPVAAISRIAATTFS